MMSRAEIIDYVVEQYGIDPDYPWARTPNYAIFRHPHNRKWFGAIVDVTPDKLGLEGQTLVDALNLKCDPLLVGSLRSLPGVLPAYHMNKEHWVTILLDGPVPREDILHWMDLSYALTR